jgi:hypothetical protein
LYWYQQEFIYDCLNSQRVVAVFSRQTGKSLCISFVAIIEALRNPGKKVLIFAPTDLQAGELFDKIAMNLKSSNLMSEVIGITKRSAVFKSGASIEAYTVGPDGTSVRGLTGVVIILEEAAFIKDSIVSQVINPMGASTNAKFIKIGTPFGMNHFYNSAFNKEWILHQYSYEVALKVGHFKQEFIDEQKKMLADLEFRTEYGAEFINDQDAYFKNETIQNAIMDYQLVKEGIV